MPYKASERSCALANFMMAVYGCLRSLHGKSGHLKKGLSSFKIITVKWTFWGLVFSEAKNIPTPPETQPCSSPVGLTSLSLITSPLFSSCGLCEATTWVSLVNCVPLASGTVPHTYKMLSASLLGAKHLCSRPHGRCNMCETRFLPSRTGNLS